MRQIKYPGEYFQDFNWRSESEIVFATRRVYNTSLYRLSLAPGAIRELIVDKDDGSPMQRSGLPPALRSFDWSPGHRFVRWDEGEIADLESGKVHRFDGAYSMCWKSDDSAVVCENLDNDKVQLIDTATWESTDLSNALKTVIGKDARPMIDSDRWTPDDRYVILYNTVSDHQKDTGYIIQPKPFKVILKRNQIMRWSPVRGWAFLQGNRFEAIDYSGTRQEAIEGWPNDWLWSPDGQHTAEIKGGNVVILKPRLPDPIVTDCASNPATASAP